MKRTEYAVSTPHLEMLIITEEPDADELSRWEKKAGAMWEKKAGAIGPMGMPPAPPQASRYLMVRTSGAEQFVRVEGIEARTLQHVLNEISDRHGCVGYGLPRVL